MAQSKEQRGLWHAIDDHTGAVLAYVFGPRKEEVFLQGKALREPWGRPRFSPDRMHTSDLASEVPSPGKRHTQKIVRQHLTLRTRLKRLGRKTISCAKTPQLHDIVMGLLVN